MRIRATFFQSSSAQFYRACVHCSLELLFADNAGTSVWSSVVGLTCCRFWDASLFTTVIKTAYFSYNVPLVSLNRSGHFPPRLLLKEWLVGCFAPFCINSSDNFLSQLISNFWSIQTSPSGSNNQQDWVCFPLPHCLWTLTKVLDLLPAWFLCPVLLPHVWLIWIIAYISRCSYYSEYVHVYTFLQPHPLTLISLFGSHSTAIKSHWH